MSLRIALNGLTPNPACNTVTIALFWVIGIGLFIHHSVAHTVHITRPTALKVFFISNVPACSPLKTLGSAATLG